MQKLKTLLLGHRKLKRDSTPWIGQGKIYSDMCFVFQLFGMYMLFDNGVVRYVNYHHILNNDVVSESQHFPRS